MNKTNLMTISKSIRTSLRKHSPEILTGIGSAGMITTAVLAVRSTPKALILIDQKKNETEKDKLKPIETIKTTWICYVPSAVTCLVSILCLIGASSVNARRNAALATAYALSESAVKEYRDKVIETIGEKKEQSVRDAIAKDKIDRNPISNNEIIVTEKGNTRCYDVISGRYFTSDIDKLKKVVNELNRRMLDETYISLNDFYYEIGLRNTSIGDDIGWNINEGFIDLYFSSQLDEENVPCVVLNYQLAPRYDYQNL